MNHLTQLHELAITKGNTIDQQVNDQINLLNNFRYQYKLRLEQLMPKLNALAEILQDKGFEIMDLWVGKTGNHQNLWNEGDNLRGGFNLKPTKNNIKYYAHNGYTSTGAGRNRAKLEAQADKLMEILNKSTLKFHVNQFCFENIDSRGREKSGKIICDFWL